MTNATEQGTFRLLYRSTDRMSTHGRREALGALFSQARSNNKQHGVTGALLLGGDTFVQVLEGEESTVRSLYERISRDPRHDDVAVLDSGPVPARLFSRWAMAEVSEDGGSDLPLLAGRGGITEGAPRRTTPEQEVVLDVMRVAARATAESESRSG